MRTNLLLWRTFSKTGIGRTTLYQTINGGEYTARQQVNGERDKKSHPGPPYAESWTGASYDVDTRVASEAKRLGQGRQCGLQFPLAQPTMELAPLRQG